MFMYFSFLKPIHFYLYSWANFDLYYFNITLGKWRHWFALWKTMVRFFVLGIILAEHIINICFILFCFSLTNHKQMMYPQMTFSSFMIEEIHKLTITSCEGFFFSLMPFFSPVTMMMSTFVIHIHSTDWLLGNGWKQPPMTTPDPLESLNKLLSCRWWFEGLKPGHDQTETDGLNNFATYKFNRTAVKKKWNKPYKPEQTVTTVRAVVFFQC